MTWVELEDFLQALITDLTGKTVIWAKQNAPKPKKPYITLRLFALRTEGMDEVLVVGSGELLVQGHRAVTLEVEWYGAGAMDGLTALEQSLYRPTVIDRCVAGGVAFFDAQEVQELTGLLDGKFWEERASIDFSLRFTRSTADSPGYIETVTINDTIQIEGGNT